MKTYIKFLTAYYKQNKMQFFGPLFTLIIVTGILFGSISATKLINEQTAAYFYAQYGQVEEIVQVKDQQVRTEAQLAEDITSKKQVTYLQSNAVFEQGEEVEFLNLYGVGSDFFQTFPFKTQPKLVKGQAIISVEFAKKNQLKVGEKITLKHRGQTFTYPLSDLVEGDFLTKEQSQGANVFICKPQFRQDSNLPHDGVTMLAGSAVAIKQNQSAYSLNQIQNNTSAKSQQEMIKLVVAIINSLMVGVSSYILFGFYRMAFLGKLHYFAILNIMGIQKRRLISLIWLENLALITIIYLSLALLSFILLPLAGSYYLAIYGLLLLTGIVVNSVITRRLIKTNVLNYILGREQTTQKIRLFSQLILLGLALIICLIKPELTTFLLVGLSGSFWLLSYLVAKRNPPLKLINLLNREGIVTEIKAIMIVALISLLTINGAIFGVQKYITTIYENWNFDQQITIARPHGEEIKTYLAEQEINYGELLWQNYASDKLSVKQGQQKLNVDDLLGLSEPEDLAWFKLTEKLDFKTLNSTKTIYLNETYRKLNLGQELKIEGETYHILGYFKSQMSATNNVAIVSEKNFRQLNQSSTSQLYFKGSENIITDLYGEFGERILGQFDAKQQRQDNLVFMSNLESILLFFVIFIALISFLSLLNSFFILRDQQKKVWAIFGAAGLTKKKLMHLNSLQIFLIAITGCLIGEMSLIFVLSFFEWLLPIIIGQQIRFICTSTMQIQGLSIYAVVFLVVWFANRQQLKKMNILATLRER